MDTLAPEILDTEAQVSIQNLMDTFTPEIWTSRSRPQLHNPMDTKQGLMHLAAEISEFNYKSHWRQIHGQNTEISRLCLFRFVIMFVVIMARYINTFCLSPCQRRQKVIQKENDFYLQILQQALPAEIQYADKPKGMSICMCVCVSMWVICSSVKSVFLYHQCMIVVLS